MAGMTESHRLFSQSFLSKGILTGREVKKLFKLSMDRFNIDYDKTQENQLLAQQVNTINENIKPIHMEIRKAISEDTGTHYYGLVNTNDTEITKMSTEYALHELEIFKKIVELIVESDNGTVSSMDVLHLTDVVKDRKVLKKDIEMLLTRLENDKWIDQTMGEVSLSTRSILELEQYIRQVYPKLSVDCNVCSRLCIKGQCCGSCDVKIHLHCCSKFFKGDELKCPGRNCGQAWPHTIPNKEPAPAAAAPTGGTQRKRKAAEAASGGDSS